MKELIVWHRDAKRAPSCEWLLLKFKDDNSVRTGWKCAGMFLFALGHTNELPTAWARMPKGPKA